MALRIADVKLITIYSWQNIKNQADWDAFKKTNHGWQQPVQTAATGRQIKAEVEVIENNWLSIRDNFLTWQKINEGFASWLDIKNY